MDHVIDTNYLRKPELEAALQSAAPADRFILGDTIAVETMKNAQWEYTTRRSFAIIAKYRDKIWIAHAPSNLFRSELATGRDADDLIDQALTDDFRSFLAEIESGCDGPGMTFARATMPSAQITLGQQQQNHTENLKGLKTAFDDIRKALNFPGYRAADPTQKEAARYFIIKTLAKAALVKAIKEEQLPDSIGQALANGRGCLLRFQIGLYCLGFKWAINNGLDSFPAEKATNEIMDLDHALLATYFDSILTEEAGVSQLREDILNVLNSNIEFEATAPEPTPACL